MGGANASNADGDAKFHVMGAACGAKASPDNKFDDAAQSIPLKEEEESLSERRPEPTHADLSDTSVSEQPEADGSTAGTAENGDGSGTQEEMERCGQPTGRASS